MTRAEQAAIFDQQCLDMVGKRYGKLTVTAFVGLWVIRGDRPRRCVKAKCDCGSEYVYEAYRVRTKKIGSCRDCKDKLASLGIDRRKSQVPQTLCWTCQNATSMFRCPWAGGKPRDDWEATPTTLNVVAEGELKYTVQSYIVHKCAGYEMDERVRRAIKENGNKA